jgi:hypothetical protein
MPWMAPPLLYRCGMPFSSDSSCLRKQGLQILSYRFLLLIPLQNQYSLFHLKIAADVVLRKAMDWLGIVLPIFLVHFHKIAEMI